jgi:hypothetical protein
VKKTKLKRHLEIFTPGRSGGGGWVKSFTETKSRKWNEATPRPWLKKQETRELLKHSHVIFGGDRAHGKWLEEELKKLGSFGEKLPPRSPDLVIDVAALMSWGSAFAREMSGSRGDFAPEKS